jgi:hypothetical protein
MFFRDSAIGMAISQKADEEKGYSYPKIWFHFILQAFILSV